MTGAIAWIPVFTGMTRGEWRGMAGCGGVRGNGGGNRVDSRFHGNDRGGVTGCGGNDGVWRGMTGAIAWIPVFTGMTRGE